MAQKRTDRLLTIIHAARTRASKTKGERAAYDLDQPEHLRDLRKRFATGRCELTGIEFDMAAIKRRRWNSPSIDRIDAKRGYTFDNVRFVVWALNASLSDWGEEVFALIATAWLHRRAERDADRILRETGSQPAVERVERKPQVRRARKTSRKRSRHRPRRR